METALYVGMHHHDIVDILDIASGIHLFTMLLSLTGPLAGEFSIEPAGPAPAQVLHTIHGDECTFLRSIHAWIFSA